MALTTGCLFAATLTRIQPGMTNTKPTLHRDSDLDKGATETEESLSGQLPHRTATKQNDALTGNNGTDFPEPGSSPEHSGEKSS